MVEDITAIHINGQLVLGRIFIEDADVLIMNEPRVFQQVPTNNGRAVQNALAPYLGEPKQVTFNLAALTLKYKIENEELRNAYIQATTGITLASITKLRN